MSNIESIISIVKEDFSKYDSFGVIDEDSMYRDCVLAIKSLGNNTTVEYEDVILVEDSKAQLPLNFYRLKEVKKLEPKGFSGHNPKELLKTVSVRFFEFINDVSLNWNECEECCREKEEKVVRKEIKVEDGLTTTCHFDVLGYVALTEGTIKNYCEGSYNIRPENTKFNQISITNNAIKANFKKGYLHIKYAGFLIDEDGNFDFEDSSNSNLEQYLEYRLKTKLAERLLLRGVQEMSSLLPFFKGEEKLYKTQASNELKLKTLKLRNTANKIAKQNSLDFSRKSLTNRYTL